jgi:hypothetical protein
MGPDMTIQRLLIEPGFAPESAARLNHLYEAAASELAIGPEDAEARARLAKLFLSIVSPLTELTEEDLIDKVTTAWGWQNPPRP